MLKLSFVNLFRRPARSFLSVVSIAIGIAVIITLVSIVDGAENSFNDTISQFQGVLVMQKDSLDQTLSQINEEPAKSKISRMSGVRNVISELFVLPTTIEGSSLGSGIGDISSAYTFVYGVKPSEFKKLNGNGWLGEMGKGSFLTEDKESIVIGKTFADNYDKFVNSKVRINGRSYKVKGILKTENELNGSAIIMNFDEAKDLAGFPDGKVSSFYVELNDISLDKKIAQKINFQFPEFEANTSSDFSDQLSGVLGNFRLLVIVIAGISALVAGIGIINTMIMSVMERRKEIGTLMAGGWTKETVLLMILLESGFLGILGGIAGLIMGLIFSFSLSIALGMEPFISVPLMINSFLFAFILSLVAGVYPAFRASKLNPIEALRVG